ncbi:MAG: SDR family NAD(P)-dependent oxidoreductase [Candidatus Acidiferrales bacterium]
MKEPPASRAIFKELFDPDPRKPGRTYSRWGGFLDRVDLFDAHFFGISPREASRIDPQQRLLLELVWEACEDAGLPATRLAGSRTAVFIGISTHDYGDMQVNPRNRNDIDLYMNSGTATSIAANRISYIYDLRGPSVAVDTACSSALTAVHLAAQSFRNGDCELAIAGGVQLLLTPELTIGFCKASMLSPDGKCKAFDASANGYVRGEGGGVVLLKPLGAALRDGDPIWAVIRSTAANQDGRTTGMTVPSRDAQQAMMEEALAKAGLRPSDIQYVEAHGPGTPVGDVIEAGAIGAVMSRGRPGDEVCAIGSVKTNIGHLEAASGIAGLIKVALSLKNRQIPRSLHFERANENVNLEALRLRVVTSLEPWPQSGKAALAGVNSFGFGGANVHVLVEEPPKSAQAAVDDSVEGPEAPALLVASARSPEALKALGLAYSEYLGSPDSATLRDCCYTAAQRRAHHDYRLAVVGDNKADVAESLSAFASGDKRLNTAAGRSAPTGAPKIGFVFSGMGPQWWGMGRQLLRDEPVFRGAMERCDAALRECSEWRLLEEFSRDEQTSRIASPEFAQVSNFAIQVALAELWGSFGITPHAVIGHSGGAMAAAYVAGVYGLGDAMRLSYHRSRLQGRPSNEGRMLAVGAPWTEIAGLVKGNEERVSLAAANGPSAITLSGDGEALEKISPAVEQLGIFARFLPVTIAYHSHAMDKIRDEFLQSVADIQGRRAQIRLMSDTTRAWLEGTECNAEYWWKAIRNPVLFADCIRLLIEDGVQHFVEIGPHPVLASSIVDCMRVQGVTGSALPTIRRNENEKAVMLLSLGALYTVGCSPNWAAVERHTGRLAPLPGYPWQRERHWFEPAAKSDGRMESFERNAGEHPLLGARSHSAVPTWEGGVGGNGTEYLKDHVVQGSVVFPGAGYVELALAAAAALDGRTGTRLREVEFLRPLVLGANDPVPIQLTVDPEDGQFKIYSSNRESATSWVCHARGTMEVFPRREEVVLDIEEAKRRIGKEIGAEEFYARIAERRLTYGPAFRGVQCLWAGGREALGRISVLGLADTQNYIVHPALLDAAFQLLVGAADTDESLASDRRLFLPTRIREVWLQQKPGEAFWATARLTHAADAEVKGDLRIFDEQGRLCGEVRGLEVRLVEAPGENSRDSIDRFLYEYHWESQPRERLAAAARLSGSILETTELGTTLVGVRRRADEASVATRWIDYYREAEGRLNELAAAYVVNAFAEFGFKLQRGVRQDAGSLGAASLSGWRLPLVEQLFVLLEQVKLVRRVGGEWEATGNSLRADAEQLAKEILQDFPQHKLDVELLGRCGARLAEVLRGQCDGRDFLLTEQGLDFLDLFYRETPPSAFYNTLVADVVSELAARCASTRDLRILEVGAGTGGTTRQILAKLSGRRVSYTFTDVSGVFLERAQANFASYPFLTTKPFDVTNEPTSQGFEPRSFDLIVASNVLHATPKLDPVVRGLKELLAPGGMLLLLELSRRPYWLDVVFGLMDGWWKFEDRALRPEHPLMLSGQWKALLDGCGFEQTEVVADSADGGEPAQAVILGRRLAEAISSSAEKNPEADHWLIFADRRGVGSGLAGILRGRGLDCTVVQAGANYQRLAPDLLELQPNRAEDMDRLLAELQPALARTKGILHLWSIDAGQMPDTIEPGALFAKSQALGCHSLVAILQQLVLVSGLNRKSFVLVTAGAQTTADGEDSDPWQSPTWGFGRVILKEIRSLRSRMIDLSPTCAPCEIESLADEILIGDTADDEHEIALRLEDRLVHRLRPTSLARIEDSAPAVVAAAEDAWQAEFSATGSLDSVAFRRGKRRCPGPQEVEVAVSAASLNFRDVVLAMGIVPGLESQNSYGKRHLGADFAGRVTRCGAEVKDFAAGDEVLGLAPGTFASYAVTNAVLLAHRSQGLNIEQASAVPLAFVTAWYALNRLARLAAGESVLIHAASGGVGLAAIQIAKRAGARIFATAGSAAKRSYVESLGVRDVFDSRSLAFADEIRERTEGRGVDVVLNSLAGEALERGIALLAPYGRFVELGKSDIYQNHRVELSPFKQNLSFFAFDLDRLLAEKPEVAGEALHEVVSQLASGTLVPPPCRTFEMAELQDAMRFMAQAKHVGKVVLRNGTAMKVRPEVREHPPVSGNATYLITGGLGGLGLEVARWLVEQGAKAIVLLGRSKPSAEAEKSVSELRNLGAGARIEIFRGDVSRADDVSRMLEFIRANMPPLRGIVHAAMVLEDAPLAKLDGGSLDRVMAPKSLGAWNLHCQTLGMPLDFFVSFSSITSLLGIQGQANYAAANAFLDSFAAYRRARKLPATTINWGVISESGYVARHQEVGEQLTKHGILSFSPAQALEVMSELLRREAVSIMAASIDWKRHGEAAPLTATSNRTRHLIPTENAPARTGSGSLRVQLEEEEPARRRGHVEQYLREQLGKLLGTPPARLEADRPLTELGLDSLIAAELTVVFQRDLGVEIAGSKLLSGASLGDLAAQILNLLRLDSPVQPAPEAAVAAPVGAPVPATTSPVTSVNSGRRSAIAEGSAHGNGDSDHRPASVPASPAAGGKQEAISQLPVEGPPQSVTMHHFSSDSPKVNYASLDYSHWSTSEKLVRAVGMAGFRALARIEAEGFENIPRSGPCILATNHLSVMDFPLLFTIMARRTIVIANEKWAKSALGNWVISDIGKAILITPNELDEESLRNALAVLRAGGLLAVAPEATRSRTGGLIRGRTGAAYLATLADVPVIPLVAWGWEKLRKRAESFRRIPVQMRAGAPLRFPPGPASPPVLREYTDRIMRALAQLLPPGYRGVYSEATNPPILRDTAEGIHPTP